MLLFILFFFFKQKTAYDMRISDWSSDVCSSDLERDDGVGEERAVVAVPDEEADAGAALDHFGRDNRQPAHADTDPEPGEYIGHRRRQHEIGRASCRERVCQYG